MLHGGFSLGAFSTPSLSAFLQLHAAHFDSVYLQSPVDFYSVISSESFLEVCKSVHLISKCLEIVPLCLC